MAEQKELLDVFDTQEVQFNKPESVKNLIQSLIHRNLEVIFGHDPNDETCVILYELYNKNESIYEKQPHLRVKVTFDSGMELIETYNFEGSMITSEFDYAS